MMLCGFAAREAIHVAAYSHLIETLGMPEQIYSEFSEYKEMKEKHDYFEEFHNMDKSNIAQQIAAFSAFTEGLQLFSSFIMLLNFPRHGKMKGMGQIVSWSLVDESCLKYDTEVLTVSGWTKIKDVTLGDLILQFDIASGNTEFVNPTKLIHSVKTESYVFESPDLHQHTTSDHRMISIQNDKFIDITAENITNDIPLVLNGTKLSGDDILTLEDELMIEMITDGTEDEQWIYDKIPYISSDWAEQAVKYYIDSQWETPIATQILDAFQTLAHLAGGRIIENKFHKNSIDTSYTKTHLTHDPMDFYCLTVPGTAFVIKSNDKISITGNCHTEGMIKLFRTHIEENRHIWKNELKSELYGIAEKMVELEDKFIDLSFSMGDMENLTAADVKLYIRYICDRRLISMGLKGIFKIKKNPLSWVDEMINAPAHGNFFEITITDYAKGALEGTWGDVWA